MNFRPHTGQKSPVPQWQSCVPLPRCCCSTMRNRGDWGASWLSPWPLCVALLAAAAAAFLPRPPGYAEAAAATAAATPAKGAGSPASLPDPVEPSCSCEGGKAGALGDPVTAAHNQPPADVSGLTREGVYFIPEPLPPQELQKGCEADEIGLPSCPAGGPPQGWGQPSSYTASLVFTPGGAEKIAADAKEGPHDTAAAAREEGEEAVEQQCVLEGPLNSAVSYEEYMDGALAAAWRELRTAVDTSEAAEKRSSLSPSPEESESLKTETPCLRSRAPTMQERRRQFLAEFEKDYSLEAERRAQRELKRLKGDIYLDYAGKHPDTQTDSALSQR
ncbi:hypothetical protein Esti_002733 [Eimeria stiedai]